MSDQVKLGYIGLGNMGAPMAKRLVEWPGGLTVFDLNPKSAASAEVETLGRVDIWAVSLVSAKSWKKASKTPRRLRRQKRFQTLFQLPNSTGNARQVMLCRVK